MPSKLTQEEFLKRAKEVHGDTYSYDKAQYSKISEKVTIICKEHGEFLQSPVKHMLGRGCELCARKQRWETRGRMSFSIFYEKTKLIHGERYQYKPFEYTLSAQKISIFCREHGEFKQKVNNHLNGNGCPRCARKTSIFPGFGKAYLEKHKDSNNYDSYLYILKFDSLKESFLKVGITKNIKSRISRFAKAYDVTTINIIPCNLIESVSLEDELLDSFERYYPEVKFQGHTETIHLRHLEELKERAIDLFTKDKSPIVKQILKLEQEAYEK